MTRQVLLLIVLLPLLWTLPAAATPEEVPRDVKLALLLGDLTEVDGAGQSFSADVFTLARWHDPEQAGRYQRRTAVPLKDVWHPTLVVYNQRKASQLLPEEVIISPDGAVAYLQRHTGQFSNRMDLREFPRDRQVFSFWVVAATGAGGAKVNLIADHSLGRYRMPDLSISDWEVGEASLGFRSMQASKMMPANPGVELTVPARRKETYYLIQVLIPLIAIVMMAYAVFWVSADVVATRVGVVMTTMLTLIAYRFMLANHVPRLAYLTRLDWFMLGATVLVLITLFVMAGTSYLVGKGRESRVRKIDRVGRIAYPLVFAAYSSFVWFR